jgi:homocysteine S-methyltransferase
VETCYGQQIETLADTAADMASAITMNCVEEALGIARAAQRVAIPVAISFTVETDGRLPTGQTLEEAVDQIDGATSGYPAYYMINCAHPTHFAHIVAASKPG